VRLSVICRKGCFSWKKANPFVVLRKLKVYVKNKRSFNFKKSDKFVERILWGILQVDNSELSYIINSYEFREI